MKLALATLTVLMAVSVWLTIHWATPESGFRMLLAAISGFFAGMFFLFALIEVSKERNDETPGPP